MIFSSEWTEITYGLCRDLIIFAVILMVATGFLAMIIQFYFVLRRLIQIVMEGGSIFEVENEQDKKNE